ncbi:MAG: J domain-containing protein [Coriobacteriia bacterium]|jgi:hypothetical protein|nr:J domain-containing protein [Coriobacteriia bacterium]
MNSADRDFELLRALKVLGLSGGASLEETKKAYRRLCKVWHPDRFPSDPDLQKEATAKLAEINAAYSAAVKMLAEREAEKQRAHETRKKAAAQAAAQAAERAENEDRARRAQEAQRRERSAQAYAEAYAEQRISDYRRRQLVPALIGAALILAVGWSFGAASATDARSDQSSVEPPSESATRTYSPAEVDAARSAGYQSGIAAGKASAEPVGSYIGLRKDYADPPQFSANGAGDWYVISLIANPDTTEAYAPLVIDAWFTYDQSGRPRPIDSSDVDDYVSWCYTSREKSW